jgi:hypothetical protein
VRCWEEWSLPDRCERDGRTLRKKSAGWTPAHLEGRKEEGTSGSPSGKKKIRSGTPALLRGKERARRPPYYRRA